MKYEFDALDHLLEVTINPATVLHMPQEELQREAKNWQALASAEKNRICKMIYAGFYSYSNPEMAGRYIRHQQLSVGGWSNQLRIYLSQAAQQNPLAAKAYLAVSGELEAIIEFILKHFEDYFDFGMPMPLAFATEGRTALAADVQLLYKHLDVFPEAIALLDIVFEPIQYFLSNQHETIPYLLFFYYQTLTRALRQVKLTSNEETYYNLNVILVFMNFNSTEYVTFSVTNLLDKLSSLTREQQLEKLRWYIKVIKQVEHTHGLPLIMEYPHPLAKKAAERGKLAARQDAPTAGQQLVSWIEEEMQYVEYQDQLEKGQILANVDGAVNLEKITTSLSVHKLAVFVEVFIATGIFKTDNERSYAATLRSVARIVHTPGTDKLSYGSLKSKAYALRKNPASSNPRNKHAIEACKDLFLECFNVCQKWLKQTA